LKFSRTRGFPESDGLHFISSNQALDFGTHLDLLRESLVMDFMYVALYERILPGEVCAACRGAIALTAIVVLVPPTA
jgi:hypothetical protein